MKYLIMTEGKTEKAFIEMLIDRGIFKIDINDMIDLRPHHKRQLDAALCTLIRQLDCDEKVVIIRIGDKLNDELDIKKDISEKVFKIEKYCTKPEFEILVIISEGLYNEYLKVKSTTMPKQFVKTKKIIINSRDWVKNYFCEKDIKKILEEYKRIKKSNGNKCLADLIK